MNNNFNKKYALDVNGIEIHNKDTNKTFPITYYEKIDISDNIIKLTCYDVVDDLKRGLFCDINILCETRNVLNQETNPNDYSIKFEDYVLYRINAVAGATTSVTTEYCFIR